MGKRGRTARAPRRSRRVQQRGQGPSSHLRLVEAADIHDAVGHVHVEEHRGLAAVLNTGGMEVYPCARQVAAGAALNNIQLTQASSKTCPSMPTATHASRGPQDSDVTIAGMVMGCSCDTAPAEGGGWGNEPRDGWQGCGTAVRGCGTTVRGSGTAVRGSGPRERGVEGVKRERTGGVHFSSLSDARLQPCDTPAPTHGKRPCQTRALT